MPNSNREISVWLGLASRSKGEVPAPTTNTNLNKTLAPILKSSPDDRLNIHTANEYQNGSQAGPLTPNQ